MNFFSRVTYNDRMTPLDFDLFRKVHILMGVTPDFFEVCLMVSFRSHSGMARAAHRGFRSTPIPKFTPNR